MAQMNGTHDGASQVRSVTSGADDILPAGRAWSVKSVSSVDKPALQNSSHA
jgi:hypothetical protein